MIQSLVEGDVEIDEEFAVVPDLGALGRAVGVGGLGSHVVDQSRWNRWGLGAGREVYRADCLDDGRVVVGEEGKPSRKGSLLVVVGVAVK